MPNATPEEINRLAAERKLVKGRYYNANRGEGIHKALSKHFIKKAEDELNYPCNVCCNAFGNKAKLDRHLASHTHKAKVAGITKTPKGRGGLTCEEFKLVLINKNGSDY